MNTKFADRVFHVLFVFAFVLGFAGIPGQSAEAQDLPHIIEVNIDDYYVTVGYNVWPDNALLTMTANAAGTIYSAQATSQENRGWWFDLPHTLNLQAGDTVTVTDGTITRTYTISPPQVTQIDVDTDTVSGTATPLSHLGVHTCTGVIGGDCAQRLVTADALGNWVADFHDPLAPAPPGSGYPNATADLVPGHRGQAIEYDDQGNATWVDWIAPNPEIEANITGQYIVTRESVFPPIQSKWPEGTALTLTVDDPSNGTSIDYTKTANVRNVSSGWGRQVQTQTDFGKPDIGLQPGFIVTVTGNGTTKTLILSSLQVNIVDVRADTVAGTASLGATIEVCVSIPDNCIPRHVTADSSGNWLANYHIPGTQPDEQETVDIQSGTNGWASEPDEDGDQTTADWYTPVSQSRLTALDPAKVWIGLKNSDDVGTKFDLLAEVYQNGTLVGSGQLNKVNGGSSGFNNAKLNTIPLTLFDPIDWPSSSTLSLKLYVHNTCYGNTHNSGTARLWYNDASANSQFGATIDDAIQNYFLRDGFNLSMVAGTGPRKTIDVAAGRPCSPFKLFGTWTVIVP